MSLDQRVREVLNEQETNGRNSQVLDRKTVFTLLAILTVSFSLTVSQDFLKSNVTSPLLALANPEPKEVKIADITSSSFAISWKTEEKTTGYLEYGTDPEKLNLKVEDEKGQLARTDNHVIRLKNLQPDTKYYYRIISNDKIYLAWEGNLFQPIKTASK